MIKDVGVKFSFQGGDHGVSQMNRLSGAYGKLHGAVNRGTAGIMSGLSRIAGIGKMVGVGVLGLTGAAAAISAIPLKLAASREEMSRSQGSLRALGLSEEELANLESHTIEFTNKWAGFTQAAYGKAFYDIQSTIGDLGMDHKKQIADISLLGGKTVEMSATEATDYFTSIWGSLKYQDLFKDMDPTQFAQQIWSQTQKAVEIFKTTGPKLKNSLMEAAPILGRQGWKFEEMLGASGLLQTAGFKPEVVGTALRNIGLRQREGLAKIMSQGLVNQMKGSDDAWDNLKGAQKKKVKKIVTDVIDESNVLYDKGPLPMLKLLQKTLGKFGRGEQDQLLKDAFGDETVSQVATLTGKLGELEKQIKVVGSANWGDTLKRAETLQRGIHSSLDLTRQRWGNMWTTMGAIVEPVISKALLGASGWMTNFTERLMNNMDPLRASISGFADSFTEAFSSALPGVSQLGDKVREFVAMLDSPNPDKLRQMGVELGNMAGTNLNDLIGGLREVGSALREVWATLKPIGQLMGPITATLGPLVKKAREGYEGYANELLPDLADYMTKLRDPNNGPSGFLFRGLDKAIDWMSKPLDLDKPVFTPRPWGWQSAPQPVTAATPQPYPKSEAPVGGQPSALGGQLFAPPAGLPMMYDLLSTKQQQQQAEVVVHNEINLTAEMDGQVVAQIMKKYINQDNARHRQGYGDAVLNHP